MEPGSKYGQGLGNQFQSGTAPGESAQPQQGSAPPVGTVQDGYKFKGGDPSDPNNWEKQ